MDAEIAGELRAIREEIDSLRSREEIREVLNSMARAADRCDAQLQASCFHPGGTDYRGVVSGDHMNCVDTLEKWDVSQSRHCIQNISFNFLDKDSCQTETYVDAFHFWEAEQEGEGLFEFIQARYLDRFERRGGVWKIVRRMTVWDECFQMPEMPSWLRNVAGAYVKENRYFLRPTRDRSDLYYSFELPEHLRQYEPG